MLGVVENMAGSIFSGANADGPKVCPPHIHHIHMHLPRLAALASDWICLSACIPDRRRQMRESAC